jgi:hypothetical protein
MMNKVPDGSNMIVELFGEGQYFSHQSRDSLSQRVVEPLNVGLSRHTGKKVPDDLKALPRLNLRKAVIG